MSLNNKYIKLVVFICLFSLGSLFFAQTKVYSAHNTALKECGIRIKEAACRKAVNECPDSDHVCATKRANNNNISGTKVMLACRTVPDPQKCQTQVATKCGGMTREALATCRTTTITNLFPAAGGPAGGAAAAAGGAGGLGAGPALSPTGAAKTNQCGATPVTDKDPPAVMTRFDLGCKGEGSPITDMAFAFVKFLTLGVGLILVISIILAGIQYATSGGNAEETSKAKDRILQAMIALIFYLLISALAQYLVPGGIF